MYVDMYQLKMSLPLTKLDGVVVSVILKCHLRDGLRDTDGTQGYYYPSQYSVMDIMVWDH